jgi:hypothetical protein
MASVGGFLLSGSSERHHVREHDLATASCRHLAGAVEAWAFAAAMLANPITWIVLAIVALVAVIYVYWEPISKFFLALWAKVKDAFAAAWSAIKGAWDAVVGFFTGIWNEITGAFHESFVGGIMTVLKYASPIGWLMKAWDVVLPYLKTVWAKIVAEFDKGFLNGMRYLWETFSLQSYMLKAYDALSKWLFGRSLKDEAIHLIDSFEQGITSIWETKVSHIKIAFSQGLIAGITQVVREFHPWAIIYDSYDQLLRWAMGISLKDAGIALLTGLYEALKGFGAISAYLIDGTHHLFMQAVSEIGGFFWDGIRNDLVATLDLLVAFNPMTPIVQAWDAVAQWLFGFSLTEAGANIVNTIVDGMKRAANGPVEAMQDIVQKVRNLLPFSPAKEGPLKDLHKVKLAETVASAVRPAPLVNAMSGAAGAAMDAVTSMQPPPTPAPMPRPASAAVAASAAALGAPGAAASAPVVVHIHLENGNGDAVAAIEAWVNDPKNQGRLRAAVNAAADRDQRKDFKSA